MGTPIENREVIISQEPIQKRVGYDLDDSVFWREVLTRHVGHAKDLILRPSLPKKSLTDIGELDDTLPDLSPGIRGRISALFHFKRTAIPGMAEKIQGEAKAGVPLYGVSGRRASRIWMDLTTAQLVREDIPIPGKNVRLTPRGYSSLESKAYWIKELGITEFNEDNKRTALYVAKLFPQVQVNYVDHGLASLSPQDLAMYTNIKVIPIEEVARLNGVAKDGSAVRNSSYRKLTDFSDGAVEGLHKGLPWLKAWHLTAAGVAFSILGIELAENQNRTGKYTVKKTTLAFLSSFLGAALDVGDGKKAKRERNEMTDEEEKAEHEAYGGAIDAAGDGIVEGWQSGSAAFTAAKMGDRRAVKLALLRLATTNLPRMAKALVGCFGFDVPETYRITDVVRGDIRFFGTSLGRKNPNYLATLANRPKGIPIQKGADYIAPTANAIVAAERLGAFIAAKGEKALSDQEMRNARTRAVVLGVETLAFGTAAFLLGRHLLKEADKNKK